ncbi:MAG: hypothetical protein GX625_02005 [Clostridiaceae bacterium]|nr:hypothetical protein [Clostridiaceae bacterium]
MKKKAISQVLSLLLVFVLVCGNTPIGQVLAFAAGDMGSDRSLEIIAFDELEPEIEVQRVQFGTDESELNLPDMLMATVNMGSDETPKDNANRAQAAAFLQRFAEKLEK